MSDETPTSNATVPVWAWVVLGLGAMGTVCVVVVAAVAFLLMQPSKPAGPTTPEVSRLAELVPDADSRSRLSAFFADFAAVLTTDAKPCKTTGDFREAYRLAVAPMKSAARLPDVKAIDEPISNRIKSAIGLEDTPLDGEPPLRSNLAAVLTSISDDFGGR